MSTDPIHYDMLDHKWYFWDETWADRVGPFSTRKEAEEVLVEYCYWLDTGLTQAPVFGV